MPAVGQPARKDALVEGDEVDPSFTRDMDL